MKQLATTTIVHKFTGVAVLCLSFLLLMPSGIRASYFSASDYGENLPVRFETSEALANSAIPLNINLRQESVSGRITDAETGESLPGVNVLVKGSSSGAATDSDGFFSLTAPSLNETVLISYIGYQTLEVPLEGRNTLDIELAPQILAGDEIVVVGYGTVRREELTSSVSSINSRDFISGAVSDPVQMIDGKVAGLTMGTAARSEEHTSELQSRGHLVC